MTIRPMAGHSAMPADSPLLSTFDWRGQRARLHLHGRYEPAAEQRLAEIADLVVDYHIRWLTVDITDMRPFAPPECLRAVLRMRARLQAVGIEVIVVRRIVRGTREYPRRARILAGMAHSASASVGPTGRSNLVLHRSRHGGWWPHGRGAFLATTLLTGDLNAAAAAEKRA